RADLSRVKVGGVSPAAPRRSRHGVGAGACGREAAIDQPLPSATLIGAALLLDEHDATVTGLSRRPEIVVARLLGALDADIGGNGMVAVRQVLLDHRRTACEESAGGKSRNDEPGTHHCPPGPTAKIGRGFPPRHPGSTLSKAVRDDRRLHAEPEKQGGPEPEGREPPSLPGTEAEHGRLGGS